MFFNLIIALLSLNVIAFIHELGHYFFARIASIGVETFSVGMGPTLFSYIDKKGTVWKICAFPLGGYVKPKESDDSAIQGEVFGSNNLKGIFVAIAGPLFNFVSAFFILLFVCLYFGSPSFTNEISSVKKDSVAFKSGFAEGDKILKINGKQYVQRSDLFVNENLEIEIERFIDGKPQIESLSVLNIGKKLLGLSFKTKFNKTSFNESIYFSWNYMLNFFDMMFKNLYKAIISLNLSGSVGIIKSASDEYAMGFEYLLLFVISLSLSVGMFNLFPLPLLDGGQIVLFLISLITRRKIPLIIHNIINYIGFSLLIFLFASTLFFDIKRLFF